MKKIILLFGIFLVFISRSFAQLNETELTPILQDAKDFAEKSNQEGFEISIEQFATWLEVKTLKPQSLNQTNRTLLISALRSAFNYGIINDNKHLTLFFEFLKYESEKIYTIALYISFWSCKLFSHFIVLTAKNNVNYY